MSLKFYDSTNKSGIVDLIYSLTGADTSSYPLTEVVRDVNLALDRAWSLILPASGTWTLDDSNQSDYPIITTNIVSGQRDYSFVTDESGNLILDVYKVQVKTPNGNYKEIWPVSQHKQSDYPTGDLNIRAGVPPSTFTDGLNTQGIPSCYDKTANGIFLDLIPNYNSTDGLRVYINREPSYFLTSDTTKKPGFAGIFHEYLALRPAFQYSVRKNLQQAVGIQSQMLLMERELVAYYGKRQKDVRPRMAAKIENDR